MSLNRFIFQQDNDLKHTSEHTKSFFAASNIEVLPWPSQSVNLSSIEHVWAYMEQKLSGLTIKNKSALEEKIIELWYAFPQDVLQNIIKSMRSRTMAVLRSSGEHTDY
ncbi:Transposable element Tc1 transposase [Cucumispora dikerogammari]|nr:Transposable element Tc1 transposase [Cucumispora dikerogammari]